MKHYEEDYIESSITQPAYQAHEQDFGCAYCWDNRVKKDIEIYFFDKANNLRLSKYCPYCGREYKKGDINV